MQPLQSRGFDTKKFFRVPTGFTYKIGSGRAFLKLKNRASGRVGLSKKCSGRVGLSGFLKPDLPLVFTALGQCPIFESISKGTQDSLRFLEFMLTFSPFDFNSTGYFELLDFTPFAWAVKLGRIDFVRVFIENAKACGIDLNKGPRKCSFQFTPLHAACWNGNPEIVRLLLDNAIEHGIHLGAGGPQQLTPLHTAIALHKFPITLTERECPLISHKKKEVVSILLQHPVAQAHLNYNASSCATALHLACFYGLTGVVQLLIEHAERLSIDLNSTDAYGRRPIDLAIEYNNNIEIIQLFTMLDAK